MNSSSQAFNLRHSALFDDRKEDIFNNWKEGQTKTPIQVNGGDCQSLESYNSSEEPARYEINDINYKHILNSEHLDTQQAVAGSNFISWFNQRHSSRKDTR